MTHTTLDIDGVTASYDRGPVIEDISFKAKAGDLIGIVGPNGAGKTTLLKVIVGSHEADSGKVRTVEREGEGEPGITYVPQHNEIDWDFPVTVEDVVEQGRYQSIGLLGSMSTEDRELVDEALEKVGMTDFRDRQIGELSGGQRQRAFLGRALAQQGEVFLMDEPFVGVDAATEKAIANVLRGVVKQGGTVVVIHHDLATVTDYFNEILLLSREVIDFGPTDEVFTGEKLERTYGGELTVLGGDQGVVLGG
jgi:manganese/zinc/iron transport system ATP- binding protein